MNELILIGAAVFGLLVISSLHVLMKQLEQQGKRQAELINLLKEIKAEMTKQEK